MGGQKNLVTFSWHTHTQNLPIIYRLYSMRRVFFILIFRGDFVRPWKDPSFLHPPLSTTWCWHRGWTQGTGHRGQWTLQPLLDNFSGPHHHPPFLSQTSSRTFRSHRRNITSLDVPSICFRQILTLLRLVGVDFFAN